MADASLGISIVQFGEPITSADGEELIAPADLVLVAKVFDDGTRHSLFQLTPDQALTLGRALTKAGMQLINAEVDDNGRPVPLLTRLSRLAPRNPQ